MDSTRWEQGYAPPEELEYVGVRYLTEVYTEGGELVCDCERAEDAALIVRLHTIALAARAYIAAYDAGDTLAHDTRAALRDALEGEH